MSGPGDGEDIQQERTRAQTKELNQEAAAGLISMIGSCDGGHIFLVLQEASGEPTKLPDCLVKEAEPELTSYSAACSSRHLAIGTDTMQAEFDGIEAAGTFVAISEIPEGRNMWIQSGS